MSKAINSDYSLLYLCEVNTKKHLYLMYLIYILEEELII